MCIIMNIYMLVYCVCRRLLYCLLQLFTQQLLQQIIKTCPSFQGSAVSDIIIFIVICTHNTHTLDCFYISSFSSSEIRKKIYFTGLSSFNGKNNLTSVRGFWQSMQFFKYPCISREVTKIDPITI